MGFWDRILCRGWSNSWPLVDRIDAATVMALDSKAALRLAVPNIIKAADGTPCIDAWDELYPSSWNWILVMRRSDSHTLLGRLGINCQQWQTQQQAQEHALEPVQNSIDALLILLFQLIFLLHTYAVSINLEIMMFFGFCHAHFAWIIEIEISL